MWLLEWRLREIRNNLWRLKVVSKKEGERKIGYTKGDNSGKNECRRERSTTKIKIRTCYEEFRQFETKTGLKQGYVLSWLLFYINTDDVIKNWKIKFKILEVGIWKMKAEYNSWITVCKLYDIDSRIRKKITTELKNQSRWAEESQWGNK